MSIQKLFDSIYVILGPTNVGIISDLNNNTNELYLIDSGMNEDDGIRIYNEIENFFSTKSNSFKIKVIINTHSHADHCGGNKYLFDKTNCEIWSTYNEYGSMINPFLQSVIIWGGNPLPELKTSYYMPQATTPTKIISKDSCIKLNNGNTISFIELPGHYFEMIGIRVQTLENQTALFTGDAFFGREHIFKYWIPFIYDIELFKKTLDFLSNKKDTWFIPSHGTVLQRIEELIEINKIAVLSTEYCILHILRKNDLTLEDILKQVCNLNNINLKTTQYALINCTLKSYLTYLLNKKKISFYIKENKMFWHLEDNK